MPRKANPPKGTYWRNKVLWVKFEIKAKQYRFSLGTGDPKLAAELQSKARAKAIRDTQREEDGSRKLISDVLPHWGNHIRQRVKTSTAVRYICSLDQIKEFLEDRFIDDVDGRLIAEIIAERELDEITNATIKRDLVALSSVMNYAAFVGLIETNPVLPRLKMVKERNAAIQVPSDEDVEKIIDRAPGMIASMIKGARVTGCRLSELTKAKRSQIDHKRHQLTVIGKGDKLRVLDLDPFNAYELFRSLPATMNGQKEKASLFWHDDGLEYLNMSSRFRALCLDLAEKDTTFTPFRFHSLRHKHAIDWLKSGRSIYDLQQRLGHTSIKTTERSDPGGNRGYKGAESAQITGTILKYAYISDGWGSNQCLSKPPPSATRPRLQWAKWL
jgi:integrase/recombinase XerD